MNISTYLKIRKIQQVESLAMEQAQKRKAKLGITLTESELKNIALKALKRKGLEY